MSLYQVHKCVFDWIRAMENAEPGSRPGMNLDAYDLTEAERRALSENDVAALYTMGLHAVLLNTYCRTLGYNRDEYKKILQDLEQPEPRRPRWQTS